MTTTARGGSGGLEDLVGVVDVEEQVGETEDWDYGAHRGGLTVVVSPINVRVYACKNQVKREEMKNTKVVVVGRRAKKMVDEM